tara:strand:+ start:795 stop:1688 length:894 start_codon:yes stop_codon:yes gene_type:complete
MKKKYKLSVNTGFAVNRFTNNKIFFDFVSNYLKINYLQLTSDFLMLNLSNKIIKKNINEIEKILQKKNIEINSTFTGGYTRFNHLAHPDKDIQNYWIKYFKNFFKISKELGANYSGSHLGIISHHEKKEYKQILKKRLFNNWHILSEYAYKINLKGLIWEPMSISREFGETISKTRYINNELNKKSKNKFQLCLDISHGDINSKNRNDYNPYKWLECFNSISPVVHLKQVIRENFNHLPFTKKNNKLGLISKKKVMPFLKNNGFEETEISLELSFKERDPIDSNFMKQVKESVDYWK